MTPEQTVAFESFIKNIGYVLLSLFVILLVKNYLSELASGIIFRLGNMYHEQDVVYFRGREARITKIGIWKTTLYMFDTDSVLVVLNKNMRDQVEKRVPSIGKRINDIK